MLKKKCMVVLLSLAALATSTAYAADVTVPVQQNMVNQPFNLSDAQWDYLFQNKTGKTLTFTLTVASTSKDAVELVCIHDKKHYENSIVHPGETSASCVTNDTIYFIVSGDINANNNNPISVSGTYNITVGQ